MARHSSQPITSLNQNWNYDPIEQLPFSGAAVQQFIKSYLGSVSKAAYFDSTSNTMYWFASDDDKSAFVGDQTLTNLVLFSCTMSFASELFRIALTNNTGSTNLNVATNEATVNISIDFDVQTKSMTESAWRSTGKGVYVTVLADTGASGVYDTIMEEEFYSAETTFEFNARNYLSTGTNRVKVQFVSEDDNTVVSSITYTIMMTEMYIEPLGNEWYVPIVETGDASNYKLGGFRIIGAVSKTLHIDIYSGENKVLEFTRAIGTTAYDRVPFYYTQDMGFDLSSLPTGVYLVSAYLTSGSLTSTPVNYNIIYVADGDESTTQLVAVNEVADVVYNYTTSTLFKYCIYNQGTLAGSPSIVVSRIINNTPTTIVDTTINDVTTGEEHTYEVSMEWLTEETLSLYVQGTITFGNNQTAIVPLDNSATFPPTYGYSFYLNAAARANSESNKLKVVNAVNNTEYTPTWENLVWLDGTDGWTQDDLGRQCLYLPARSYMTLPYTEYKLLNGDGISIEMCYKVSNVADYDETVLSIVDDLESAGFTGLRIKPTNILVHSSADTSSVNDLVRGTNVMDERVIHLVLTIYPNFMGNNGKNLVTGYVNGSKNFQFDYATGTIWNTNAPLRIGSERSDVSLYFIRKYDSVLSEAAVAANYINSQKEVSARTDLSILLKSCMDASQSNVDFEQVKNNNYNYFVVEMLNGATLPSRANNWDKKQTGLSNLEMHFGEHPDWDWRIESVETSGQGTTSMNYYRWNLRFRIDKSSGKMVPVQYLESRTKRGDSYQYTWLEKANSRTLAFDGSNHPSLKRITAKINAASSMQSHKIGATRAYNDLHDQIGLRNAAQDYADSNNLARPVIAVYQYPAFGFLKNGNTYEFIGLFTIGPDKGDKPSFGYDLSTIPDELITMEGTDHSRKMVMFNYPWNTDVSYLADNECINIVKGVDDYDNGWEVGNCHGYSTDDAEDQNSISAILDTEFKPAYRLAYENSTLILGIPLGEYAATAADTLDYINNNIATFQSQLDSNGRMTYANYQFWIEGEYVLYYYDIKLSQYVANQNLVTQLGSPVGSTVSEQNEWFKAQRRLNFMAEAEDYFDIDDTLYAFCFLIIFGAMDNFGKNSYPYKMGTLANGGRWRWRNDDLDSMLGIGNAGADNMPAWMEFQDSDDGSVYFGGSTSVFWNLIYECYYDNYVSTVTGSTKYGIIATGRQILEAMSSLAGGTNVYDGVMKFMKKYFWDNAQNYFPQSAYNADASYKYEQAWLTNGQEVAPLTQSLGNHYEAEYYWANKRLIYMMSFFKAGAFGSYADTSLGQMAFRPQSLQSLTVTPEMELYPAFASGQGMVSTSRTEAGEGHTFVGPFGTDGQTTHYIQATNVLTDIGDLKDLRLGSQYINPLQVQGKKLVSFKIGDEEPLIVVTPAVYYTQAECDAYNAALEGAIAGGTALTAEQATLVNTALETTYEENDEISTEDANAYNATLEGAISTEDIKTPEVTTPNVTTNVPGLTFDNTYCLETIDARNAASITGAVDITACKRIKEAYFGGTSVTNIVVRNGSKIEVLELPDTVQNIVLRYLKKLSANNLMLPSDLSSVSLLYVDNCLFNPFNTLYALYNSEDAGITYIRIKLDDIVDMTRDEFLMLINIAGGKDKDGNDKDYYGVNTDGSANDNGVPFIDGTVMYQAGYYDDEFTNLDVQNIQQYDSTLSIGAARALGSLNIIFNAAKNYFRFADTYVSSIVANWIGDGVGTTLAQIQGVTSLPAATFGENTNIQTFNEFELFTDITSIATGAFKNCTNLSSIRLPSSVTTKGTNVFYNCSALTDLLIPFTITTAFIDTTNDNTVQCGNGTGKIEIANMNVSSNNYACHVAFNFIYIYGNMDGINRIFYFSKDTTSLRIKGYVKNGSYTYGGVINGHKVASYIPKFVEIMGNYTNTSSYSFNNTYTNIQCFHLGYSSVVSAAKSKIYNRNNTLPTKICVGDGSSRTSVNFAALVALII